MHQVPLSNTMSKSEMYVTEPAFENHSLGILGMVSVKVGIRGIGGHTVISTQAYVNKRYGQSPLYKRLRTPLTFKELEEVEKEVLLHLQSVHGYRKQHAKKEHFIIPNDGSAIMAFVRCALELYERFISRARSSSRSRSRSSRF